MPAAPAGDLQAQSEFALRSGQALPGHCFLQPELQVIMSRPDVLDIPRPAPRMRETAQRGCGLLWGSAAPGGRWAGDAPLTGPIVDRIPVRSQATFTMQKEERKVGSYVDCPAVCRRRGSDPALAPLGPLMSIHPDRSVAERVPLGETDLSVTRLGFGSAPIGGLYQAVTAEQAHGAVDAAWESGVRFFDTAPLYGMGESETCLGRALRAHSRDDYVLATKVGRLLRQTDRRGPTQPQDGESLWKGVPDLDPVFDFSYDGAMRSLEESLERLGIDRVDIVHIHDPDDAFDEALQGARKALVKLREEGVIRAVGSGMNQSQMLSRFAQEGGFDCFLVAGRYTLLDQSALDDLLPTCLEHRISVIAAGVFNSGILAMPDDPNPKYNYARAEPDIIARARRIDAICRAHQVPVKAAAIQFPQGHPVVTSVVVGSRSAVEARENAALFAFPVPDDLWAELKADGLLRDDAPTPTASAG
jgi:D-threo-aldose 1-dehydrogenase